jgi:hypothetical protein
MFRLPETEDVMHDASIAVLDESENPDDCVGENTGITDNFTEWLVPRMRAASHK